MRISVQKNKSEITNLFLKLAPLLRTTRRNSSNRLLWLYFVDEKKLYRDYNMILRSYVSSNDLANYLNLLSRLYDDLCENASGGKKFSRKQLAQLYHDDAHHWRRLYSEGIQQIKTNIIN